MKKYLVGIVYALVLVLATSPAFVSAQSATAVTTSANLSTMLELLQTLMKQVEELQKQLTAMRGEIGQLQSGLREGMQNSDIQKIQRLLATDPTIYPKGSVTGYFGPYTREAVIAFQAKHGLTESGVIDEATRKLLEEYLNKKTDDKVAPGWMKAPGLDKKIVDKKWEDDKYKKEDKKTEVKPKDPNAIIGHSEGMIGAAVNVIADLEEAIDDTDATDEDIDEAEEDLARAETELATARAYFADKKYQEAYDIAYKAKMSAYAGIDELK